MARLTNKEQDIVGQVLKLVIGSLREQPEETDFRWADNGNLLIGMSQQEKEALVSATEKLGYSVGISTVPFYKKDR